jgi:hypothetical protein
MTTTESIDAVVRRFARLLAAAWSEVLDASRLSTTGSFLQDWLQANWEIMVEASLEPGVFLEVYGEGADCNERSSRVYRPDGTATHAVVCLPRLGAGTAQDILGGRHVAFTDAGLSMEAFVSREGTWYAAKTSVRLRTRRGWRQHIPLQTRRRVLRAPIGASWLTPISSRGEAPTEGKPGKPGGPTDGCGGPDR